jgi:tRNA-splicing ligase RtcB
LQDKRLQQRGEYEWLLEPDGSMKVPAIIYASREQLEEMDRQVLSQLTNVAALPGIYQAVYAMPDAHWGYGFPIGGVAAFDPRRGGVVSAGGVGFDISCGVRTMLTGLTADEVRAVKFPLADSLFREIPAGVGSTGHLQMRPKEMDKMLVGGAQWAVSRGYGDAADLERIKGKRSSQFAAILGTVHYDEVIHRDNLLVL